MNMDILAFVDGAVFNNGGPGRMGMGAVLQQRRGEKILRETTRQWCESGEHVTNQRAELLAIRNVLKYTLKRELRASIDLTIVSDSEYALKTLQGLYRAAAHLDVIEESRDLVKSFRSVRFEWTKGHAGCEGNERADALATEAAGSKSRK